MTSVIQPADRHALESFLAFWHDAGVEASLTDRPIDRITEGQARLSQASPVSAQQTSSAPREPIAVDTASVAQDVDQARALAAAAQDLATLEMAITAFNGCALKRLGARQSVFSRGPSTAPLMLIGEAPGADEDREGRPFVGRSGQLLDKILQAAGLLDRALITNTVFWRPPGNRTPTFAEQAVCLPFVERAIALVEPKILLLVGGAAAKAMLQIEDGVLSLRGRWLEWRSSDGAMTLPAMVTLHPAFLLRQPAAKSKVWYDFLMLSERLDRPHRDR